MLAVIEDETGAGKTEAALILAQRMMQAGNGRGLFFALPSMATADAMFARAETVLGRLFAGVPSVTLAHGRSALSERYRSIVNAARESSDTITCTPWLAENRRKALLADRVWALWIRPCWPPCPHGSIRCGISACRRRS
jgi:CRISPR-associated endonuclease/helicase Cas3